MLVLTIRTDKPEAEIGLFTDDKKLAYETWQAHRQLAETIHLKIDELLKSQQQTLKSLNGIIVYQGPGSFTGLRIGLTVANVFADSLTIPIVAASGAEWINTGQVRLSRGDNEKIVTPKYGSLPHITKPRK